MRTVEQLVLELHAKGVKFWLEGDRLRFRAPEGVLTPELRAEMAEHRSGILALLNQTVHPVELQPIQPAPRDGVLPLSFAQQRLWLLDQLGSGDAYNMPLALQLRGCLDIEALQHTLTAIEQRHESLRTTFESEAGTPYQVIHPPAPVVLTVVKLSHVPGDMQSAEVQRLASEAALLPFNLATDRMWRTTLLQVSADDHVLLLTLHHIATDGWSMGVLVRELTRFYEAFTQGLPSPLPELPIQYADFAHWQRQWLQGEVLAQQLAYWRDQLTGAPPLLDLPTDRPRPAVQTHNGAGEPWALDAALTQQLHDLSREAGTTLFMTLLAAFTVLLARHSDQEDLVIGTPIANRTRVELEGLIGCFLNTLALRVDLSGNPTFVELLAQVRQVTQDAYEHQDAPFEQLIDELHPERNPNHNPLVQVAFALQNAPMGELALPGLSVSFLEAEVQRVHTDLEWYMWERDGVLAGACTYNRDLFDASTIARLGAHFRTLLAGIMADLGQRLSSLPLLSEAERQQILVEWNATETSYPADLGIPQVVQAQVERSPDATAVVYETRHLTYGELNARANQLAHHLRHLGVGPDVLVGLCLERSLEMVVGVLGIVKAGGAYVPLDPTYPPDRLRFMLDDAQAQALVTQAALLPTLPATDTPVVCLDRDGPQLARWPRANPSPVVRPEHLAYVIYTSGSTGQPKGVLTTHGNLLNFAGWHVRTYGVTSVDRVTQNASLAFDAAAGEVWPQLAVGACLYLTEAAQLSDPVPYRDWLIAQQMTLSFVPTAVAEQLIALAWPEGIALEALLTGGDKLHQGPETELPFSLVNNYGPTENTVASTSTVVPAGEAKSPPIGRPIANVQVYVLDRYGEPVPVGTPGELCLGGASVARGYHRRSGLSAERFIPNRFGPGRLYRSGDLGRYRSDGTLEFLGRMDTQVQIRGFRIELGEIEAVLGQHPEVRETAVVARDDQPGHQRLVAYVVPRSQEPEHQGPASLIPTLLMHLKEKLPDYMVPAAFVLLDALPLTPNGKVDHQALPTPSERPQLETAYTPPETEIERQLVAIWQELLQVEQVGIHDDFFALGGNSLVGTRFTSQVRAVFQIEVALRSLFDHPTIASLAQHIEALNAARNIQIRTEATSTRRESGRL